jgi:Choline/Carnitine o-acyltransferase
VNSFPAADSVFSKVAEAIIDAPLKRKYFLTLLSLFGIISYAEQNRQKMISLAEREINPFDIDTVPKGFSGIYPEFSFSILFEKMGGSIAQRAAKLVLATLKYRQLLLTNSLEKETSGGRAIDNCRNHNFFSRVANIRKTGPLSWNKDIKHCNSSSHIVVAVYGAYYKLDIIDPSGAPIPADNILHNINSIIRAAAQDKDHSKPYGVATTNVASADIFYADWLDESIKIIDEAIFLLAIDGINILADENEAGQALHIGNHHNRDYRKSLQLVVMENGFSGATINLFAEIEGVAAARFASWISSYARNIPPIIDKESANEFVRLRFETVAFNTLPLAEMKAKIARYSCMLPLIKRIDAIGRDGIKQLNVSPDAFFHVAAHLAYYERFNRVPSIHNFADMRGIKFGSITRYLSTTNELVEFLKAKTKPALLNALAAHKKIIAVIKSGDYPLHYAYHYLYTAPGFRPLLGMIFFKLFAPDIFRKHVAPDIGASSIPALPGISCLGRFGTFFKAGRRNCLAGHYLIFPDHIKICFLSSEVSFLESWEFDRALADAMMKLKQILAT